MKQIDEFVSIVLDCNGLTRNEIATIYIDRMPVDKLSKKINEYGSKEKYNTQVGRHVTSHLVRDRGHIIGCEKVNGTYIFYRKTSCPSILINESITDVGNSIRNFTSTDVASVIVDNHPEVKENLDIHARNQPANDNPSGWDELVSRISNVLHDNPLYKRVGKDGNSYLYERVGDPLVIDHNDPKIRVTRTQVRDARFRKNIVKRDGVCQLTGISAVYCDAIHLKAHNECNHKERIDTNNGLLVHTTLHRAYDRYDWTVDEDCKVIIRPGCESDMEKAGLLLGTIINLSPEQLTYVNKKRW